MIRLISMLYIGGKIYIVYTRFLVPEKFTFTSDFHQDQPVCSIVLASRASGCHLNTQTLKAPALDTKIFLR